MVRSIKKNQIATSQAFRNSTCYHISTLRLKLPAAIKVVLTLVFHKLLIVMHWLIVDKSLYTSPVALHALCRLQRVSRTLTTSNPLIL